MNPFGAIFFCFLSASYSNPETEEVVTIRGDRETCTQTTNQTRPSGRAHESGPLRKLAPKDLFSDGTAVFFINRTCLSQRMSSHRLQHCPVARWIPAATLKSADHALDQNRIARKRVRSLPLPSSRKSAVREDTPQTCTSMAA